jgi:hypothetical protein
MRKGKEMIFCLNSERKVEQSNSSNNTIKASQFTLNFHFFETNTATTTPQSK